jgi:hypothetical protein
MKVIILTSCLLAFLFTFSTQTFATDFTVNLTTDEHDAGIGDGICDIDLTIAGPQCSLRAAAEEANGNNNPMSYKGPDRILFNLPANSIITLTTANGGEIRLSYELSIIGTGANNLTINGGAGTNRIFFANNQYNVTISGMTLTDGNGTGANINGEEGGGGAIKAIDGSLTLDSVNITGNSASFGGGVDFDSSGNASSVATGTHRIINSTIAGNKASGCAGINNITIH